MGEKTKQTGPPVRIGAYQLSVTVQPNDLLARAVLVDHSYENLPGEVRMYDTGMVAFTANLPHGAHVFVPHKVSRALFKMAGWNIEYPDSMNPNMKAKEPGQK